MGLDILEQSLAFFPLTLGVYLSFAILCRPDLTVDGTFVLGGGLFARLIRAGVAPSLALLAAIAAGAIIGALVASLQRKGRLSPLTAGILMLFVLQSLNLVLMGQPNLSLLHQANLLEPSLFKNSFLQSLSFGLIGSASKAILLSLIALLLFGGITLLLRSSWGLTLRAFGSHASLLQLMGKSPEKARLGGLMLSNALVALGGSLTAQLNGYADIGMGVGLVLVGLGTVIIGQQIAQPRQRFTPSLELTGCLAGVVLYFVLMHTLLALGINPIFLKMVVGIALIFLLLSNRQRIFEGALA